MRHYYYVIDPVQEKRFANFVLREFKVTDARVRFHYYFIGVNILIFLFGILNL